MKKILALVLALVLALTALCAVAETAEDVEFAALVSVGYVDADGNLVAIEDLAEVYTVSLFYDEAQSFIFFLGEDVIAVGTWGVTTEGAVVLMFEDGTTAQFGELTVEDQELGALMIGDVTYLFMEAPEDYFIEE